MTFFQINSNKDFDLVFFVFKTSCLFCFRGVKFHYVILEVSILWRWRKFVLASQQK